MAAASVLLISSDRETMRSFRGLTDQTGMELRVVRSLPEASRALARQGFDVLFVQIDSPGGDVHRWLSDGVALADRPPAVVFSRHASIPDAVAAMRCGACHYIVKPPADAGALKRAISRAQGAAGTGDYDGQPRPPFVNAFDGFLTADHQLLTVCETIARIAPSHVTPLIEGESGTGKSLLARMLHRNSPRRFAPFVEFRCAPLSEQRIRAALFGRESRFELADGGTLVLEDVAGLSTGLKAHILRTAATGRMAWPEALPAGAVHIRLVLTQTAPSGGSAEAAGEDDFWGLSVVRVRIPPLRERVVDIPLLAAHFQRQFRRRHGRRAVELSSETLGLLVRYDWPGNVTELRNAVEHAVILTRNGAVMPAALPPAVAAGGALGGSGAGAGPMPLKDALREPERRHILRALNAMGWNKQHAARRLQISRSTLYKKMKALGLGSEEMLSGMPGRP